MKTKKITLLLTVFVVMIMTTAVLADDGVIRVNFQAANSPPPLRTGIVHLEDIGETYANRGNGYSYGWDDDETGEGRRRYMIGDCRLDGHVRGNGNTWEIALSNGSYLVNVAIGDPDYTGNFSFGLEGSNFNDPDSSDNYYIVEDIAVTVSDGKLTLDDTSGELKVCYIEIVDAAVGFPAKQTFPTEDPSMLAFPTAEGAARHLTGGRGGDVYHVTSLDWDGPGTLKWGLGSVYENHPRTIVFDVSGYIGCSNPTPGTGGIGCGGADGDMTINANNITIAGQTAPGKGITIRDHTTEITGSSNVIMRYLRFRLGDENKGTSTGADVITPEDNDGIMLDHLSVSWGIDGEMDSRRCGKFTTQWCIFAEPLHDTIHYELAPHGYLMSWRNLTDECTIHHNFFSSGVARHPTLGANELVDYGHLSDFRNNVNYNFGGTTKLGSTMHNFINNYYKYGPLSFDESNTLAVQNNIPYPWGYLSGNVWTSIDSRDAAECAAWTADNYEACSYNYAEGADRSDFEAFSEFSGNAPVTESAAAAYQSVMAGSGCSLVRDTVDERILNYAATSTAYMGGYEPGAVDSQSDVGGWDPYTGQSRPAGFDTDQDGMPDAWETALGLDPSDPDDRNDDEDGDGYTNLEEYLNELAGDVEPEPDYDAPTPDPMTFATAPYSTGSSSISMTATTATDVSGVEYFFTCTAGGGNDSGWQIDATYEDTGLSASTQYTYTVKARDMSAEQNETAASAAASATTDAAPLFDPIYINFQLDTAPVPSGYLVDGGYIYADRGNGQTYGWSSDMTGEARDRNDTADQRYDTLVHMKATWELEIPNGNYTIDLVMGDSANADMINDVDLEGVLLDDPDGLDNFDEFFDVSVTVTDGKLTICEQASANNAKICFIEIESDGGTIPDTTPPTPDPASFASAPAAISDTAISMTATTGSDASGPVEYLFTCTAGGGNSSLWQTSTSYTDTGLTPSTQYTYTVTMRDSLGNTGTASEGASATTDPAPALPAAPSSLSATAIAKTQIDLSWTDNATDETGFKIERSKRVNTSFAQIATVGSDVTSYSDTTVSKGTTYFYRVRATNADGDSAYSNEDSATTPKK